MKEDKQEKNNVEERKQYIKKHESNIRIDVIKIRLHMWNTKCNLKSIR